MGETHLQKATYFLEELLQVPLTFEFILYKHGPFSFELRDFLAYMEGEEFITWQSHPPYGPSLRKGSMTPALEAQYGKAVQPYLTKIEFVAERLGAKNVGELERIATALYVTREDGVLKAGRASRICELKPHIEISQAQSAVAELDAMMSALRA